MNYNDFPILTDSEYEKILNNYNASNNFSRHQVVSQICFLLKHCYTSFSFNHTKLNNQVKDCLYKNNVVLDKLYNNLATTFSISANNVEEVSAFNIFTYLKNLSEINELLNQWQIYEKKEYYKNIITSTLNELNSLIINLLSILEKINILLFKHM